jgi:hypothetical protein
MLSLAQNARLNMELTAAKQKALMELESKEIELEQLGASKVRAKKFSRKVQILIFVLCFHRLLRRLNWKS